MASAHQRCDIPIQCGGLSSQPLLPLAGGRTPHADGKGTQEHIYLRILGCMDISLDMASCSCPSMDETHSQYLEMHSPWANTLLQKLYSLWPKALARPGWRTHAYLIYLEATCHAFTWQVPMTIITLPQTFTAANLICIALINRAGKVMSASKIS